MIPTTMDRKTFLANLRQSGLIRREELRALRKRLPETNRGRLLARALVEWGLLTKFQAELLLAGRTSGFLLGQYRILDELGRGGMGRVFKAVHQTMNRVVALKVLAPNLVWTDKAHRLFQREVQAAALLIHPNIVTAYDANQLDGRHYLVMEFVDGPNLEQLVRECGPLPIGLACDLIRQAAVGLQYAFEKGMVHRDVKPSNILVQPGAGDSREAYCVAKITDFGLARVSAADGDLGTGSTENRKPVVMGTPDFLSPEQARDANSVDIRSDIYSLGCTLYFLLTKKVPYPGGTSLEKLVRQATEEPIPVEHLRTDLPADLAALVRRMMAKDAKDRFQTPGEVALALAPFAVAGPTVQSKEPASDTGPTTPAPTSGLDFLNAAAGSPPGSAQVRTLSVGNSPTPNSAPDFPSFHPQRVGVFSQRRVGVALGVALGIVAAGLGVVGWLLIP
jgi:serine/threonine-protein kinase